MSLVELLKSDSIESEIRRDVETVVEAERSGVEFQNGKKRNTYVSKNTHFEYPFGDGDDEVVIYLERLDSDTGVEVMFWVDESYFTQDQLDASFGPDIADAGDEVEALASEVLKIVTDEIEANNTPGIEFMQMAPPSAVFSAIFYLSE